MYKNKKVSLVIPCLNEEEGLRNILPRVPKEVDEIIIVDGNSQDNTAKVAEEYGAKVIIEKRHGYGLAYKIGFSAATGDIITNADGDGTYPVEAIIPMLDFMLSRQVKFVSACRFPLPDPNAMLQRNFGGNVVISAIMSLLFKSMISDGCSGMWLFERSILDKVKLKSDKWAFSNEIKLEAAANPNIGYAEFWIGLAPRLGETKVAAPWTIGLRVVLFIIWKRLSFIFRKKETIISEQSSEVLQSESFK